MRPPRSRPSLSSISIWHLVRNRQLGQTANGSMDRSVFTCVRRGEGRRGLGGVVLQPTRHFISVLSLFL